MATEPSSATSRRRAPQWRCSPRRGGATPRAPTGRCRPPGGPPASPPARVGAAVVSAMEHNRGEVTVAPLRQRVLARFAANAPELSSRLAGDIAAKAADEIAAGQTDKR